MELCNSIPGRERDYDPPIHTICRFIRPIRANGRLNFIYWVFGGHLFGCLPGNSAHPTRVGKIPNELSDVGPRIPKWTPVGLQNRVLAGVPGCYVLRNLVGLPGFEPGTSCTPSKRASQAAPQPEYSSVHAVASRVRWLDQISHSGRAEQLKSKCIPDI
jgi:hypothetical protein